MKRPLLTTLASLLLLPVAALAGESGITHTYQPLNGLGSGSIEIESVACYEWNAMSGLPTAIYLISAENRPPTLSGPEHPAKNLNFASIYQIYFTGGDVGGGDTSITLDASQMKAESEVPADCRFENHGREKIVRACLECLRRSLREDMAKLPVTLSCKDEDKAWLEPIVKEFNEHDRTKVFFEDEG